MILFHSNKHHETQGNIIDQKNSCGKRFTVNLWSNVIYCYSAVAFNFSSSSYISFSFLLNNACTFLHYLHSLLYIYIVVTSTQLVVFCRVLTLKTHSSIERSSFLCVATNSLSSPKVSISLFASERHREWTRMRHGRYLALPRRIIRKISNPIDELPCVLLPAVLKIKGSEMMVCTLRK